MGLVIFSPAYYKFTEKSGAFKCGRGYLTCTCRARSSSRWVIARQITRRNEHRAAASLLRLIMHPAAPENGPWWKRCARYTFVCIPVNLPSALRASKLVDCVSVADAAALKMLVVAAFLILGVQWLYDNMHVSELVSENKHETLLWEKKCWRQKFLA